MIYGIVFIDYLRLIYDYNQKNSRIRNIELSRELNVSRPTVTNKLKLMIKDGYVLNINNNLFLTEIGYDLCQRINQAIKVLKYQLSKSFVLEEEILNSWALSIIGNQDFENLCKILNL